jgi:ubiquinone/menaquinone biosynthesis C-methylase UbiE
MNEAQIGSYQLVWRNNMCRRMVVGKNRSAQAPTHEPCEKSGHLCTGHHGRNSSEKLLDKTAILQELAIAPGQTIVDAGCGDGYMARVFFKVLNGTGRVYALDQAGEALETLMNETKGTGLYPLVADITRSTPIMESSIDLIYLSNVFHVFAKGQIQGFNQEVRRLLKPGGRLAIVELKKQPTPVGPPLEIRYAPKELERAIDLPPVSVAEAGPYHYLQIFRKQG